jgi:hypothetical protein
MFAFVLLSCIQKVAGETSNIGLAGFKFIDESLSYEHNMAICIIFSWTHITPYALSEVSVAELRRASIVTLLNPDLP